MNLLGAKVNNPPYVYVTLRLILDTEISSTLHCAQPQVPGWSFILHERHTRESPELSHQVNVITGYAAVLPGGNVQDVQRSPSCPCTRQSESPELSDRGTVPSLGQPSPSAAAGQVEGPEVLCFPTDSAPLFPQ